MGLAHAYIFERKVLKMTVAEFKERFISDYESGSWKLVERIAAEMAKRGIEPNGIEVYWDSTESDPIGTRYIVLYMVHRHNGTEVNVSADIAIYEKINKIAKQRIAKFRVPKDASDRVINNRIDKAFAYF